MTADSARRLHIHLHLHRHRPAGPARGALLFIHGAYADSRYWHINFTPFFQRAGYDCHSLDLSGHGQSAGRERLDEFGIDDYAADVAHAVAQIGEPVVLIGHSMGALVAQRYLEKASARAAIFLAPVPPLGTAGSAANLAFHHPQFFQALEATLKGQHTPDSNAMLAKIYFSPDSSGEEILDFLPLIGPESHRAVTEMALLYLRPVTRRARLPVLVVGGEEDRVFPANQLMFSAVSWQGELARIPGAGHMLPLDDHWQTTAQHMLDWMSAL